MLAGLLPLVDPLAATATWPALLQVNIGYTHGALINGRAAASLLLESL